MKLILKQTRYMLFSKFSLATFFAILTIVFINYISNLVQFHGHDVATMVHPMKLLLLSYSNTSVNPEVATIFVQVVPILICLPAGLSYTKDIKTGEVNLIVSRIGTKKYMVTKILSTVLTTTIVFSIPFLIEIFLNCLAFPLDATGDPSNFGVYSPEYLERVQNYQLKELFFLSPYVYSVVCTIIFGFFMGLIAGATMIMSTYIKVKYDALLLLPSFLLFESTLYLEQSFHISWYKYFMFFNHVYRNSFFAYTIIILLLALYSVRIITASRLDVLK